MRLELVHSDSSVVTSFVCCHLVPWLCLGTGLLRLPPLGKRAFPDCSIISCPIYSQKIKISSPVGWVEARNQTAVSPVGFPWALANLRRDLFYYGSSRCDWRWWAIPTLQLLMISWWAIPTRHLHLRIIEKSDS